MNSRKRTEYFKQYVREHKERIREYNRQWMWNKRHGLSQAHEKKTFKGNRVPRGECAKCGKALASHERCELCEILLHTAEKRCAECMMKK